MWEEDKLNQAINLLVNFYHELWQIDRVDDAEILKNALDVLNKQLEMLNGFKDNS